MSKLILTAVAVSLLGASTAMATPLRYFDRLEDRADRYEDRIDRRVTYGPRDRIEDRVDLLENRVDERNLRAKCAKASASGCADRVNSYSKTIPNTN
ncbi:MAG: hypothetical protein AAF198_02625 [Pseudomonadota bacterium]